ncbi:pheromone-processing carboxypeptidase KEX1-like [Iris pallida]|uniref:Pheromone-processing carboxypeptidase KEX1-like n=1 Tax=Iris pallida TaxID=29817 RepID=A0AAX6IE99_IRIPA|nr:pheromone-processing carboxypeptidase KEX1-like [Iris pallida]
MTGSGKKEKKSSSFLESEVDQLLKAAEDHVLLNLKLNSHTKSSSTATHNLPLSSSSSLDPDLTRRFEALKSAPTKSESVDVDHLSARFDALKSSLGHHEVLDSSSNIQESDGGDDDEDDDGVSQKEVEKLMQWAMDAARLESASKTKDEIDDGDEDKEEEDDDEDSEEERKKKKKESNSEGKGKPKKWYFF